MPLKFKPKAKKAEIPLPDGAVVLLERCDRIKLQKLRQEARKLGLLDSFEIGEFIVERYIVGWRGIVGEDDKTFKFNDENRASIYEYIKKDVTAFEALYVFEGGILGNSQAGSTAKTTGDGTNPSADDASMTK